MRVEPLSWRIADEHGMTCGTVVKNGPRYRGEPSYHRPPKSFDTLEEAAAYVHN